MGPSRVKKIWANYDSLESLKNESIKVINQKTNIPLSILKEIKKTL
jgi:excinuclease UvrABC nuclease subunit